MGDCEKKFWTIETKKIFLNLYIGYFSSTKKVILNQSFLYAKIGSTFEKLATWSNETMHSYK